MLNPFTNVFGSVRVMPTISWSLAPFFFRWMTWRKMWKHSNLSFLAETVFYICPPSDLSQGWEESLSVKYAVFLILSAVRAELGLWIFWNPSVITDVGYQRYQVVTVVFKVFTLKGKGRMSSNLGVPAFLINSSLIVTETVLLESKPKLTMLKSWFC